MTPVEVFLLEFFQQEKIALQCALQWGETIYPPMYWVILRVISKGALN